MRRRADPAPAPSPLPCTCGTMPVQETRKHMLGKIQDGGYTVIDGRYKCPSCGKAPGWGQCYCVDYGWDNNIEVWNRMIGGSTDVV